MKNTLKKRLESFSGTVGLWVGDKSEPEFTYQSEKPFLAASMIKLFILWELYQQASKEKVVLSDRIEIQKSDHVGGFGVLTHLDLGLTPTLRDLATLMINISDNVATNKLIDYLGIEAIQNTCLSMGWKETQLQRKMFDREAIEKGRDNYTSARDLAGFYQQLLKKESIMPDQYRTEMISILKSQQLRSKLPAKLSYLEDGSRIQMAHKTGDIPYCEHDGGILFTNQGEKIIILLTGELKVNWLGVELQQQLGEYFWNYWN